MRKSRTRSSGRLPRQSPYDNTITNAPNMFAYLQFYIYFCYKGWSLRATDAAQTSPDSLLYAFFYNYIGSSMHRPEWSPVS